jgi:hypothetical protein
MKAHEFSVEGTFRHSLFAYWVAGCVIVATAIGTWIYAHSSNWFVALFPAPSAMLLLWLSYSIIWNLFIWRWKIFQRIHRVPVFEHKYRGLSISNDHDQMPPRDCEITIYQTWTSILIRYESSLMQGHSITAAAFPDSSRVIAIMVARPRHIFDQDWMKKHSVSMEKARKFATPQHLVVTFQFKDGMLEKAEWYTDLQENHLGEFSGFERQAEPGAAPDPVGR